MIQEAGIDLAQVQPEALDMPFGLASGAGAIFGVTGGVTEAVLRRLVNSSRAEDLERSVSPASAAWTASRRQK